jgi:arylsulfatase A-like enzyme
MRPRPARSLALTLAACAIAVGCDTAPPPGERPPNIVFVIMDDLGWDDAGEHTAADLETPHLDALARQGVRFTRAYAVAPICSPSRAGLLTGRYPQRFGHENNTGSIGRQQQQWIGLPLTEHTLADELREAGYVTGMIGKWHLGVRSDFHPMERGFDEFFGFTPGHHAYHQWSDKRQNPILRGREPAHGDAYLTDAFTSEAVDFIERHADQPFFLVVAYSAVHAPLVADPARRARFDDLPAGPRQNLAAVLAAADDGLGAIDAALERTGVAEDTLTFVTSDNGSDGGGAGGLRGRKASLYEGGIRVPLLVRWPGHLPGDARYAEIVSGLDLFATARAAAGGPASTEPLDGVDLAPFATGAESGRPHEALFWRVGEQHAMRQGRWKLHWVGEQPAALYDLIVDPGERRDLAAQHADQVAAMRRHYAQWEAPLASPRWNWVPGQLRPVTPREPADGR